MAVPLDVFADLNVAVDGEEVDIWARGNRIVVDLPSLRAGRRMLQAHPLSVPRWQETTDHLRTTFQEVGLTMDVQLQGELLARIGADAEPTGLSRALNVKGVEFFPRRSLRQVVRRRPILTTLVVVGFILLVGGIIFRVLRS